MAYMLADVLAGGANLYGWGIFCNFAAKLDEKQQPLAHDEGLMPGLRTQKNTL